MKKMFAMLLAALLVVVLLPMSVSARNMTSEEKELFAYLREAAKIIDADGSRNSAEALAQGENYIATLQNPLTAQQIALIKGEVDKAVAEVKAQMPPEEEKPSSEPSTTPSQGSTSTPSQGSTSTPSQGATATPDVKDWDTETRKEVLGHISNAASILGCTVTAGNKGNLTFKDESGKTIIATGAVIKTTGFGAERVLVAGAVGMTLLCATAFVAKKIELF